MNEILPKFTTSKKSRLMIFNASTAAGLTGLAYNTAGLTWRYFRDGDTTDTAVTIVNASTGTYTSGGFKEVDSVNWPGLYEIGHPNLTFNVSGGVLVGLQGAASMKAAVLEYQVNDYGPGFLAPAQAFNNTGQTTPLPGIFVSTGVAAGFNSIPIGGSVTARTSETLSLPFSVSNWNASGWTQMVFTIKADPTTDDDSQALATVRITNGGSGTDGLLVINGITAASAAMGSLTVDTSTPNTLNVTVALTAAAMALIPPSNSGTYTYELTQWISAAKRIPATGAIAITQSARRGAAAP